MFSKAMRVKIRGFHRWAGIVIGIQLLFWISSGLYFAWMPIKIVKDEDRKADIAWVPLTLERLVPPQALNIPSAFLIKSLRLDSAPAGVMYRLESTTGELVVFDAQTGLPSPHLRPEKAMELALQQIQSQDKADAVQLLEIAPAEYKGPLPVYRVVLNDFRQTRLYLDPWSGKVIVRRNMFWRVYDFLWMLHILDFEEREDFNNPWLRILSLSAFILVISGYILFLFGRPPLRKNRETAS